MSYYEIIISYFGRIFNIILKYKTFVAHINKIVGITSAQKESNANFNTISLFLYKYNKV